jgi:hypothetical protein
MNRVTVEDSLRNQLLGLAAPVEVVDETGRPLGHFVPRISMSAPDDCPYSLDQLDAMRSESGGRPLAEIWKSLGTK